MSRRHLLAFASLVLLFGCGRAFVFPLQGIVRINTSGGATFSPNPIGFANVGGNIRLNASQAIDLLKDVPSTADRSYSVPAGGTELTNAMIVAGTPIAGSVRLSSTLQITGAGNPATLTATGDVIIAGSLIAERGVGATTNSIVINATSGTIYIEGSVLACGSPGAPDNPNGGNVTLNGQRIVVYGSIDTRGESSSSGPGGNGGAIRFDSLFPGGLDILVSGGVLNSNGGSGTTQGGNAGNVTLEAGLDGIRLWGDVTADGGAANVPGSTPTGGNGGTVTLRSSSDPVQIRSAVSMSGGSATGFIQGALGGDGGTFIGDSPVDYVIFGSITAIGGTASALQLGGGALIGGTGGNVDIGVGSPVRSLSVVEGVIQARGGEGSGGANAGDILVSCANGNIAVGGLLDAQGGASTTPNVGAGAGGSITIQTDADPAGNTTNHTLTMTGEIRTTGGSVIGGAIAGAGGPAFFCSGADLTLIGTVNTSGGSSESTGTGGDAGPITFLNAAANLAPFGRTTITGDLLAQGGASGGIGGDGNTISITTFLTVTFSGTMSTRGETGRGAPGSITIVATSLEVHLAGVIRATGGLDDSLPTTVPADVTITAGTGIWSSARIDVSGADAPQAPTSNVEGGSGGTITMTAGNALTLQAGSELLADGGDSESGSLNPPGGAGGRLVLRANSAVVVVGRMLARGGLSPGAAGGPGGQVVVNSDSNSDGIGGQILVTAGTVIDVSGGIGLTGGSARNNGGVPPANSSGANLAVVFDAAGGLTGSPDGGNEGQVLNFGTIVATGNGVLGRGGDIWFDGKNNLGLDLTPADGGHQVLTGPFGNGAFFPN